MSLSISLSILWQVFFYAWLASEIYIAIATRTPRGSGKVRDRGTMLLLWVVIFSFITLGSWFAETHDSNLPGGAAWVKLAALVILVAGLALRWAAVLTLGKSFSSNVAIHATQTIMRTGPYRWMRHPSYTGLLLCIFAVALRTRNWISLLVIFIPITAALLYRIHIEEIVLHEHFGEEYSGYCSETKRLIPGVY
jgi:protein-S-isoprenylcysteine O-methyltransferase Ste14